MFNFLCGRCLFFSVFPFPVCKARLIGDWLENRRSAPNCSVRLFLFFLSCPLRILTFLYIFCVWSANSNWAGDIGPPIYWRTCPPPPIGNADQTHQTHWANKLAQGASVRQKYWRNIRKMIVFSAPRLFSYQLPINWALQTGNGNTLQKRRRAHKKINRHRSPRSGTLFYQ